MTPMMVTKQIEDIRVCEICMLESKNKEKDQIVLSFPFLGKRTVSYRYLDHLIPVPIEHVLNTKADLETQVRSYEAMLETF